MRGFSLIELIFVIVIAGILTFTGLEFIPDNTLSVDTQVLKQKIMQKHSAALGYKNFTDSNVTCIKFDTSWINSQDEASGEKVKYKIKSSLSAVYESNGSAVNNLICFDDIGRVYDGNVAEDLTNLLHTNIIITLKYRNEESNLTLFKISGFVK